MARAARRSVDLRARQARARAQITYGTDYSYFVLGQFKTLEGARLPAAELETFSHEHYSSPHSTTLRAAMGRSVWVASNPGRTKERRIESFAGQQAPRSEKAKEKPARLR